MANTNIYRLDGAYGTPLFCPRFWGMPHPSLPSISVSILKEVFSISSWHSTRSKAKRGLCISDLLWVFYGVRLDRGL
jgi:hypothetical protein